MMNVDELAERLVPNTVDTKQHIGKMVIYGAFGVFSAASGLFAYNGAKQLDKAPKTSEVIESSGFKFTQSQQYKGLATLLGIVGASCIYGTVASYRRGRTGVNETKAIQENITARLKDHRFEAQWRSILEPYTEGVIKRDEQRSYFTAGPLDKSEEVITSRFVDALENSREDGGIIKNTLCGIAESTQDYKLEKATYSINQEAKRLI